MILSIFGLLQEVLGATYGRVSGLVTYLGRFTKLSLSVLIHKTFDKSLAA